jgi:glycerate 2-kinase
MTTNVLIAPSGFKESLDANACAERIAEGIRQAMPDANIIKAPMADGGEGFVAALVAATDGTMHDRVVTGPVGRPVEAYFGFLGGRSRSARDGGRRRSPAGAARSARPHLDHQLRCR